LIPPALARTHAAAEDAAMRALLLVVLAASPLLRAQDLPAVEVREVAGTRLRYAVQTPSQHAPATWAPLLVLFSAAPGEAAALADLAAVGVPVAKAGFVVVAPVRGDGPADLRPLFAVVRRTFRIEQGGMHAAIVGDVAGNAAGIRAHRHEFQTVTWLDGVDGSPLDALRRLPARRVFGPPADGDLGPHFLRVHGERVLAGAADAIARVLDDFHDAAANGDEARYFAILPDDAVFLGTDGAERWTGAVFRREFAKYFERDSAWTYVCLRRAVDVDAGGQWATFDETFDNEAYGECRGSGVVVQRDGRWVLRQYHLSVPVPNDLARPVAARIRAFQDGVRAAASIVLVRHAEKASDGDDPELSAAGRERAGRLAAALRDVPFTTVYTSELRRTAQTVAPLCMARAITPTVLRAADTRGLAAAIQANAAANALVCGHSNTVPQILAALGVRGTVTIADDEYDRLFVVTLGADGPALVSLRY